jgi:hypothetical protein
VPPEPQRLRNSLPPATISLSGKPVTIEEEKIAELLGARTHHRLASVQGFLRASKLGADRA